LRAFTWTLGKLISEEIERIPERRDDGHND
jgi:hypothetical protein